MCIKKNAIDKYFNCKFLYLFRHTDFRPDYNKLKELPAIFEQARFVAMSGTLTKDQVKTLPEKLGLKSPKLISINPDRPNIFLEKKKKVKSNDVMFVYEDVFKQECLDLKSNPENYPATIMYIPMFYMSCAIMISRSLFGEQQITESCYSAVYANQDDDVMKATLADLNRDSPKIRLVLSTSVSGMGFDPPSVTRVVHVCPPRSLSQYLEDVDKHPQLYYTTVNEILQVIYLECLMI